MRTIQANRKKSFRYLKYIRGQRWEWLLSWWMMMWSHDSVNWKKIIQFTDLVVQLMPSASICPTLVKNLCSHLSMMKSLFYWCWKTFHSRGWIQIRKQKRMVSSIYNKDKFSFHNGKVVLSWSTYHKFVTQKQSLHTQV